MESTERLGSIMNSGRAWVITAVLAIAVLAGGVLAFPRLVYDRFIWQYFWGPIYADAHNAACAVRSGGSVSLLSDPTACSQAEIAGKIVAEPGYTLVSEAGYALTLIFMLAGILFFLRWAGIGRDRQLFFALVPFMFFGGALRVVEDAIDAAPSGAGESIGYPLSTLIISPIIYFVVFAITLAALMTAIALSRRDVTDGYVYPTAGIGTAALVLTIGYIGYFVTTVVAPERSSAGFYPQFTVLVVLFSVLIAGGVYLVTGRIAPWVNEGTQRIGIVVLFAHSLDGVANVLAADWTRALGLPFDYSAKHPINRVIIEITGSVLPQSMIETIGTAWPFLLVKVVAAVAVVSLFDERIFEDSPRYALLLLVAIVAVGLGPGTRDMLRATFGI